MVNRHQEIENKFDPDTSKEGKKHRYIQEIKEDLKSDIENFGNYYHE